jgi:hypothetical protein
MSTTLAFSLTNLPPLSLPLEEATYLLGYLRKQPFDRRKVLWAVYRLIDFAAEQIVPGTPEAQIAGDPLALLESELSAFQPASGGTMSAFSINWKLVLQILLTELLPRVL